MAFDEDIKMATFLKEGEEEHHYSLSRLSLCCNYDGEPSDSDENHVGKGGRGEKSIKELNLSDSEKGYQSLPATPPRRIQRRGGRRILTAVSGEKAYSSENETRNEKRRRQRKQVDSMRSGYGGGAGGVVVVTRPRGGGRALCMDLEEVKACKELGFEIEPGRVSYSGSTMDTSSGGNSPNHRISSPGDDPKDVKARLKAWAQAVAFVSTTLHQPPNSL